MDSENTEIEAILDEFDAINTQSQELESEHQMLRILAAQSDLERIHQEFFTQLYACLEEGSVESLLQSKEGFNTFIDSLLARRIEE
jgi:hypothetical protein